MRKKLTAIWLAIMAILLALCFAAIKIFEGDPLFGLIFVMIMSAFIGLLIALPVGAALAERLMEKLFGFHKGGISKDYSKAKRLLVEERFEEAIEEFRRAVEKEPESVALRLEIAEVYAEHLHDYQKAIKEYEEALKLGMMDSERVSTLNRIADIFESDLGDGEMAARTLSRIVQELPGTKFAQRAKERLARTKRDHGESGDVV